MRFQGFESQASGSARTAARRRWRRSATPSSVRPSGVPAGARSFGLTRDWFSKKVCEVGNVRRRAALTARRANAPSKFGRAGHETSEESLSRCVWRERERESGGNARALKRGALSVERASLESRAPASSGASGWCVRKRTGKLGRSRGPLSVKFHCNVTPVALKVQALRCRWSGSRSSTKRTSRAFRRRAACVDSRASVFDSRARERRFARFWFSPNIARSRVSPVAQVGTIEQWFLEICHLSVRLRALSRDRHNATETRPRSPRKSSRN